ncbi:enoyl-CoA hydratase [Radiobacillus kanasensis]|uniref:MaoC/PaaZ C-terminal domain-containing protein n=1 Tax=Radiobacillus kanasensis TaxID=2844358 RepID=UPI001E508B9F|nr:MaoC/PaaZ C-terminal domain-containing protein [Radiobacillus kanasensis]UFT98005.1 enoyl-CoA hydratase [Radiobacillus kanasensis]
MIGKKRKLGKHIQELAVGDSYRAVKTIEDRDILLYLGLTDDANPLYIQHDYASQTPYKQPVVPSTMLIGIASSMVSMHLPGPGCHILEHHLKYPNPVYHYSEIEVELEVVRIQEDDSTITIRVIGKSDNLTALEGTFLVKPAAELESLTARSLQNFN